jgi:hypothetical protein
MYPTWREVEIQAELSNLRIQEASERRLIRSEVETIRTDLSTYQELIVRLGTWMVSAGDQLRSRYDEVAHVDPQMRSLEQGC